MKSYIREALNEIVLVANLAALVLGVLLCCSNLLGAGIRLAGNLLGNEQHYQYDSSSMTILGGRRGRIYNVGRHLEGSSCVERTSSR